MMASEFVMLSYLFRLVNPNEVCSSAWNPGFLGKKSKMIQDISKKTKQSR